MRTVDPQRHAAQRARIISAAAEEFAGKGVDGTSTAAICERAGIGSGTLFHYFPTKRDIFRALFGESFKENDEICRRALDLPAEEGFDLLIAHLARDLADPLTPGLAAAAVLEAHRDLVFAEAMLADETVVRACLTELLRRTAGTRPAMLFDAERTALWIMRLVDAAYMSAGSDEDSAPQISELRLAIDRIAGRWPASAPEGSLHGGEAAIGHRH